MKIWLPPNYETDKPSQVIYVFDAAYYFDMVVSTVKYYADIENDLMPQSIVVGVYFGEQTDRNDVGYDPGSGKLDSTGKKFYNYFINEVDPYVTGHYIENPYRVYFGWSYLANYADYFLTHNASFFDAFMLFAPEAATLNQYDPSEIARKRLYLSIGADDVPRRIDNGKRMDTVFSKNNKGWYHSEVVPHADHNTIVIKSLPNAVAFIYKDYGTAGNDNAQFREGKDNIAGYAALQEQNRLQYKTGIRKTARNFARFTFLSGKENTIVQLDSLTALFYDEHADPNLLEIIGGVYSETDRRDKAEQYLKLSINKYWDAEQTHRMFNVYKELGYNLYYKKNGHADQAIALLQEGIAIYPAFETEFSFLIGEMKIDAAQSDTSTLDQLKAYLSADQHMQPPEKIYFYLAKCSIQLGSKEAAKGYLEKSLKEKKDYQPSLQLKNTLQEQAENPIIKE